MTNNYIFQPLPAERIKERTDSIEIAFELISVTLLDGEQLIGGLAKHWRWGGKLISLGFNTEKGKRFGISHIVDIPLSLVANIQPIPLSEASIPKIEEDDSQLAFMRELGMTDAKFARLPVQDYPNPLASVICNHNLHIIASHNLAILDHVEMALSKDAIPSQGIFLTEDFLLYVDWDFYSRQTTGSVSVNAGASTLIANAGITKDLSPSLQEFVLRRLKISLAERIRKGLSPKIIQDNLVQGCIIMPEPTEDTEIEGEKCIVALCAVSQESNDQVAYPILVKLNCLKFPIEFLGQVNSLLTFYGESLPIPLNVMGRSYKSVFLARAIAYLDGK